MSKPLKGFITYSHEDAEAKKELRKRLAVMEQQNELVTWDDGQLTPGDGALQEDILKEVADSDLLLYLVSAASLASKNCNRELAEALKQEIRVIPIILEHCDWPRHQLSSFEVLPHKGKPITSKPITKWEDESEGWQNVVDGIWEAIDEMRAQPDSSSGTSEEELRAELAFQQGNVQMLLGQLDMAIEVYSDAIELNPCHADAYNNRGVVYGKKRQFNKAVVDFNKAIELKPDYAGTYRNRGKAYSENGEFDLAIEDYNIAIELKPDYAKAHNDRGGAYYSKGEIDLAIADYNTAIKLDPDYATAYSNRGGTYVKKGDYDRAIVDCNMAIELKHDFADAYNNRGVAYNDRGEHDRAIKDFTRAIELKPDHADAYNNRGNAYENKGEIECVIGDYTKAIELKPDYTDAYNNRGIAHGNKGDVNLAIEDFTKAIELKPDYTEAHYNRGVAYGAKGEVELTIEDYTKAIELKPDYVEAHNNRGNAYISKREYDLAIKDYTKAIELKPDDALTYSNRGTTYCIKGKYDLAIKDYTKVIELKQDYADVYYNRGEAWLHLREWENAKADLTAAKKKGMDIIAAFRPGYKNVEAFERQYSVKLPKDIALLLTQRRRTRYPKTQKLLDADGNPLESPNVVNLRAQLRNAGALLGEYIKTKPSFGINTAPTEVFVVDRTTRDKLIAAHPSSADILKPFLHGQDLRRWHVDTPQQWLIFTHRGIAINDYPAILKHLEKYREVLRKRKGKQKWYELPVSLGDAERFAQPKLVCPNTYNHQTFAVDTAGYYYGNTSYLILTEEMWLCGLLNSRTVEWFYSQVSNQLTIDYLRARSGYIQQIPIPDVSPEQKTLIAKLVDYLIYLQQQPTTNSKDLKHARDAIMLGYFERIIDGLIYEAYLPEDLHKGDKHFFQPLLDEQLPSCEEIQGDKLTVLRDIFELLYERTHLVRRNLYYLDSVKAVRIIEGKI